MTDIHTLISQSLSGESVGPIATEMMELARPLLNDNWTVGLGELSMPTIIVPITKDQFTLLGPQTESDPEWTLDADVRATAMEQLDEVFKKAIHELGGPVMVKMGARSPKDSTYPHAPLMHSFHEFMIACKTSIRMSDDSVIYRSNNVVPKLYFRKSIPMQMCDEWRCLMYDRTLVAISQLDYPNHHQHLPDEAALVKSVIQEWFKEKFEPNIHVDEVVFDVHVPIETRQVTLIDLNPVGYSDPCLIDLKKAGDVEHKDNPVLYWVGVRNL